MSLLTLLLCIFVLAYYQVSADQATEAIIGGDYAEKGKFKFQVSIQYSRRNDCGGAIIDDHYILTAAHCVTRSDGGIRICPYRIIAGTNDLKDKNAIVVDVETIYIHKNFNRRNLQHDIALLKLKRGLNLNSNSNKIEKINLPKGFSTFFGVIADVAGFGLQSIKSEKNIPGKGEVIKGHSDDKLKHAKVRIISHSQCIEMNKPQDIFSTLICGQVYQHNMHHYEGVCDGDSGGPLVHRGEVIGILSTSPLGCNESSRAATYTRVSSYLKLIHNVINGTPDGDVVHAVVPI